MDFLTILGVNFSIIFHFAIFLLSFTFLYLWAMRPYHKLHQQRLNQLSVTKTAEVLQKAKDLHNQYAQKAQALNQEIDAIFQEKESHAKAQIQSREQQQIKELEKKMHSWNESLNKDRQVVYEEVKKSTQDFKALFLQQVRKS